MLHAQASLQPDSKDGLTKQGDILALVFPDHPWGTEDRKQLLVVEWDDPEAEAALQKRRDGGEKFPATTLPYAVWTPDKDPDKPPTLTMQSTKAIDIMALPIAATVLDKTVVSPILPRLAYNVKITLPAKQGLFSQAWDFLKSLVGL